MNIVIKEIKTNDLITKSKLPSADYVINPYVGCTNACRYCYACFMKRFTNHSENWGEFLDVKICEKPINTKKLIGKSIFMASVCDAYNDYEKEYKATQKVLEQLVGINCELNISTKNKLILRDLDLLKQMKNLVVDFSINTVNEEFRKDMDRASTIAQRFEALKVLNENGIKTAVFVSPIFPELSEFKEIIKRGKEAGTTEFWFENLNLRGDYKYAILNYIKKKHPSLTPLYTEIYEKGDTAYWNNLWLEIETFCKEEGIKYKNYFHHEKTRKD